MFRVYKKVHSEVPALLLRLSYVAPIELLPFDETAEPSGLSVRRRGGGWQAEVSGGRGLPRRACDRHSRVVLRVHTGLGGES